MSECRVSRVVELCGDLVLRPPQFNNCDLGNRRTNILTKAKPNSL